MMRFDTTLIRGTGAGADLAHVRPLELTTTYRTPDTGLAERSIEDLAAGEAEAANPVYQRLQNPNVRDFEVRMTALEEGVESVAFGSGMAALTALVLASRTEGSHVVAVPPVYGGTHQLLDSGLLGTSVTWAPPDHVGAAIRPDTGLVLVETPANPTLTVTDIAALVDQAGTLPVAVDSTFATPVLQRPIAHGAAHSVHSATKFIGGHGDALGGVVTTSDGAFARRLRQVRILTGGVLHPMAAYLLSRGLQTLGVRVRTQQDSARELVRRLSDHPAVLEVLFPGMGDPASAGIVARQMNGPGAVLSIRIAGAEAEADRFIQALRLATPAVSLGSVDTLVQRPASLTHHALGRPGLEDARIPQGLVRISVGMEDVEDLWSDLDQALHQAVPSACGCSGR